MTDVDNLSSQLRVVILMWVCFLAAACGKEPAETAQFAAAVPVPAAVGQVNSQKAADEFCYQIRYGDDADKIAKSLESGISPNVHDKSGLTPLVMALMQGSGGSDETQAKIVDLLLARGADTNLDNGAALNAAVGSGKAVLVQKLLDKGADVNLTSAGGLTPLMAAVHAQSSEIVSLLLDRGANADLKSANGKNAWKMAFENAYAFRSGETIKIEELLRGRTSRADIEALLRADTSLKGYLDADKWLQEHP